MKRHKYFPVLVMLSLAGITSCKKFLEVENPAHQIVASDAFGSNQSAASVMSGIYTQFAKAGSTQGGGSISLNCGLSADEFSYPAKDAFFLNNALGDGFWPELYQTIYNTSNTIEKLQDATSQMLTVNVKKQLTAECKFLRAWCYFYLVNLYGDVPLLTHSRYFENAQIPRTPVAEVYGQMVKDLEEAKAELDDEYLAWDAKTKTTERSRPNRSAASALLARVYLYQKKYSDAEKESTEVIARMQQYKLHIELDSVFLKESKEAIWQLQPDDPSSNQPNTKDAEAFLGYYWDGTINHIAGRTWISKALLNSFEPGDLRRTFWVGEGIDTVADRFPYKYQQYTINAPQKEYLMMLRLSEQYLIQAEALAARGDMVNALKSLNAVRKRAGLGDFSDTDPAAFAAALLKERRTELFSEWGHRWFDLKRLGLIDAVMSQAALVKGTSWNANKAWFAIPYADLKANGQLKQNNGYPAP